MYTVSLNLIQRGQRNERNVSCPALHKPSMLYAFYVCVYACMYVCSIFFKRLAHPDEGALDRVCVVSIALAEIAHRRAGVEQNELLLRGELEGRLGGRFGLEVE